MNANLPSSTCPQNSENAKGRLPALTALYEGKNTPGLFVLGNAAHSRDYRASAGGFIHGFRYTGESPIYDICFFSKWLLFYNFILWHLEQTVLLLKKSLYSFRAPPLAELSNLGFAWSDSNYRTCSCEHSVAWVTCADFTYKRWCLDWLCGFSAAARAVHRILEQRYHNNHWTSTQLSTTQLQSWILKRVDEASGPYQMFEVLGDVILLRG